MIGGDGDGELIWGSSGVIGESDKVTSMEPISCCGGGGDILEGGDNGECKYSLVDGDKKGVCNFGGSLMDDDEVALDEGVLDGAFGTLGDDVWSLGEGVVLSSLVRSMNSYFGGKMVIFGFLHGLVMEAFGDAMVCDSCWWMKKISEMRWTFGRDLWEEI